MIKNAFQSSNRGSSHNHRSTHSPAGVSNFSVSRITKPSDITINERDFRPPSNQNQFRAEGNGQSDQKWTQPFCLSTDEKLVQDLFTVLKYSKLLSNHLSVLLEIIK